MSSSALRPFKGEADEAGICAAVATAACIALRVASNTAGNHRRGRRGTAGKRPWRQRRIAEHDLDPVERNAGAPRQPTGPAPWYVPVPMSWVAHATRALPSALSSTVASQGMRSASHEHPATPQPRMTPSRFIDPTSGVRRDQPNFSAPVVRHSTRWRDRKRQVVAFIDFRLVAQPELDRVEIQLDGQLVNRGFGRVNSGHRAGAAHRGRRADMAAYQAGGNAQVGRAVGIKAWLHCNLPCSRRASMCGSGNRAATT